MEVDMNYKTEQFLKEVIDPTRSQFSARLLKELR